MPLPMTTAQAAKTGTGFGTIIAGVGGFLTLDELLKLFEQAKDVDADNPKLLIAAGVTILAWIWKNLRARRALGHQA